MNPLGLTRSNDVELLEAVARSHCDEEVLPATLLMPIPVRITRGSNRCPSTFLGESVDGGLGPNGVGVPFSLRVDIVT